MSEQRDQNRAAVLAFLADSGPDRWRAQQALLAKNAVYQAEIAVGEAPVSQPAGEWVVQAARDYPQWGVYQPTVYECGEESRFLVRTIVVRRTTDREDPSLLSAAGLDSKLMTFELEEGKIKLIRMASNRCELWPRRYLRTWDMTPEQKMAQREKNLETIRYLMTLSGPDRNEKRRPHFAEDGVFQLETLKPMSTSEWLGYIADDVPYWGYYDPVIFQCDDPCSFAVETCVVGKRIDIKNDRTMMTDAVLGAMVIVFEMMDGKVKLFREIPDEALLAAKPR